MIREEIPEAPEHEKKAVTASAIKQIFEENKIKGDASVASLPAARSINRTVTMPLTDDAKIKQTLKFKIEPQIPYPIDQVICDGILIRKLSDSTEMLAIAVVKEPISDKVKTLEMAGVNPQTLILDALALADFYINPLDFSSDRVTALLIMDGRDSFLGFFQGDRLIGYRNLSPTAADGQWTTDKLVKELQRSIVGFQSSSEEMNEVGALCLAGHVPESLHKALQESFRELPVRIVEFNERKLVEIPPDSLHSADDFKLAIALAHAGLKESPNHINLRQEEFAPPSIISQMKPTLILTAAMLVVMVLAWFGNLQAQIYGQARRLNDLNDEIMEIFADTLPGISSPSVAENKIKEEQEKFRALRNYSSEYISPLEVLAEIVDSVPSDEKLALSEMHISDNVVRLRGTVDSFDDIDVFKTRVENSLLLSDVKIESAAKAEKGEKVTFRIRAQVGRESKSDGEAQPEDTA
jgi:type II secretion system protein L